MTRGTGYRPDPPGHRYNAFRAVHPARSYSAAAPMPNGPIALCPGVWDQNGTGSCGGHGAAGALTVLLRSAGFSLAEPAVSPLACYRMARMIDRAAMTDGPLPALTDSGVQPNELARGLQEYGLQLEGDNPTDKTIEDSTSYAAWLSGKINSEPSLLELEKSAARELVDWTSIADGDPQKVSLLLQALHAGYPAMFAVDANTDDFQNYDGSGVLDYGGQNPDHMQYICGCREAADGSTEFRQVNSWGTSWGDNGMAWVSQRAIQSATFDMLIPRML